MKEQFVDFETAKMLKELGFDEETLMAYHTETKKPIMEDVEGVEDIFIDFALRVRYRETSSTTYLQAPLYSQLKQWLFDNHTIYFGLNESIGRYHISVWDYRKTEKVYGGIFDSPITAEIEGIKKAVEYLHSKQQP